MAVDSARVVYQVADNTFTLMLLDGGFIVNSVQLTPSQLRVFFLGADKQVDLFRALCARGDGEDLAA